MKISRIMDREELIETMARRPIGFGGVVTQRKEGDMNYDERLILRQDGHGEWQLWQLVLPMFKVGDCIRAKDTSGEGSVVREIDYGAGCYVFGHGVRGSYVSAEYELVPYEPMQGDVVRRRGEERPLYRVWRNADESPLAGEFRIWQVMEAGASAGSNVSRTELQRDYVLVERTETPLVRESRDESIRKALLRYFRTSGDNAYYAVGGISTREIIAWLERPGGDPAPCEWWSDEQTRRNLIGFLKSLGAMDIHCKCMTDREKEIQDLIAECDGNISSGEVNSFASYDEGVRDALLWLCEGGRRPDIGREL